MAGGVSGCGGLIEVSSDRSCEVNGEATGY